VGLPDFWDDPEKAQKTMQELTKLKDKVEQINRLERKLEDIEVLYQLGREEGEEVVASEITEELEELNNLL